MVPVSAKMKINLDLLLEMILLVADLQDLKANPARPAMGNVLEAKLDRGRGPVSYTHLISIDKPEGVSHSDCEVISHQVGTILDVEDVVPGHYTLEVSSPGLERKLLKPRDFERFQGKKAKVTLRAPVENQRHWEGTLAGFADGVVSLEAAGRQIRFPLEQVEKANLKFEW